MPGTTGTRTQNIDPVIDGIEVVEEFKGRPADPLPRLLDFCTRPTGAWPYVPASRVTYPTPQDILPRQVGWWPRRPHAQGPWLPPDPPEFVTIRQRAGEFLSFREEGISILVALWYNGNT